MISKWTRAGGLKALAVLVQFSLVREGRPSPP